MNLEANELFRIADSSMYVIFEINSQNIVVKLGECQ
jgi:hypothetical protein